MKISFDVNDEVIDEIIIKILKQTYEDNRYPDHYLKGDQNDQKLLDSIEEVLKYFMTPFEYKTWAIQEKIVKDDF